MSSAFRELARSLGIPVAPRPLPAQELRGAQEAFLSSSGGGVLPVTRVDGRPVGHGRAGPVTQRLLQAYWDSTPVEY